MHQPTTAALLEPAQLEGVCAESASSPVSGGNVDMQAFTKVYRERFGVEPDAFALGQYDGMRMVLPAVADGDRTPAAVTRSVGTHRHDDLPLHTVTNGSGNRAHSDGIACSCGGG